MNKKEELNKQIQLLITQALHEDYIFNDITSKLIIPDNNISTGRIFALENGILAGIKIARQVFQSIDHGTHFRALKKDGDFVEKGTVLGIVKGRTRVLLAGERTALNFLQHLSGIASLTNKYVTKLSSFKTKILDTRKTLPGWRYLEKYAVSIGGACNHRGNLQDLILVKDNHIKIAGGVPKALNNIFKKKPAGIKVEVEVESLKEVKECLVFPVDIIMLDNMNISSLKKAVKLINGKCLIEASGGINLNNVVKIAKCGVDYISIGRITSSAPCLDIHMEF
ncbi:carboxylating nicotinate-nucleotide diphosphorylase [Candidatus Desantisbacteria bacterium]|nr:carboxylating nicotinate-nucleotide diphosphorylase [Candidatus Desantisbacteria bacterium]